MSEENNNPEQTTDQTVPVDQALTDVVDALKQIPNLSAILGNAIRQGIDSVIDGPRTNRWSIEELEKTEKAYIGTRVEILVRAALGLPRGKAMDYLIAGHEIDSKFSIHKHRWMIPQEALNHLCLLISMNEKEQKFLVGVVRIEEAILTKGTNQDEKRNISAEGRNKIQWLVDNGNLPQNFLQALPKEERAAIFAKTTAQERVIELFRRCPGRAIPGASLVEIVSEFDHASPHVQRAAQDLPEYEVLSGDDETARTTAKAHNIELLPGYYTCIKKELKPEEPNPQANGSNGSQNTGIS